MARSTPFSTSAGRRTTARSAPRRPIGRGDVITRLERDGKKQTIFDDGDLLAAREEKEGEEGAQQQQAGGRGPWAKGGLVVWAVTRGERGLDLLDLDEEWREK